MTEGREGVREEGCWRYRDGEKRRECEGERVLEI